MVSLCCLAGRHCPLDEFQCNNTLCKPLAWKCDGEDDCGDNSDENPDECSKHNFFRPFVLHTSLSHHPPHFLESPSSILPSVTILYTSFSLHTSFSHHPLYLLQSPVQPLLLHVGRFQCPPTRPFRCQNERVCLPVSKRCDSVNNCGDNSDEQSCRKLKMTMMLVYSLFSGPC